MSRVRFFSKTSQSGLTLIELLVVFSIIAIVSSVTVASFVTYSRSSALKQSAGDVANLIQDAKSRTQSQVKPASCTGNLNGYRVDICIQAGGSCTANTYKLVMLCSGNTPVIKTQTLPSAITFDGAATTSLQYRYQVLSNGVTGSGKVVLNGYNTTNSVIVDTGGNVSVQ